MGLTLEQWELRISNLPQSIREKFDKCFMSEYDISIEQWNANKTNYDCYDFSSEQYILNKVIVEDVTNKYGYNVNPEVIEELSFLLCWDDEFLNEFYFEPNYELALIVNFLRQASTSGSELTLTTTIKGIKSNINIKHKDNIEDLHIMCDSLLYAKFGSLYELQLNIPSKETHYSKNKDKMPSGFIDANNNFLPNDKINVISGIVDPFSELEMKKIIEYEHTYNSSHSDSYKSLRKDNIKNAISLLKINDVFSKSLRTISTKEACCIYDILAELNTIIPDPTINNQEKYQYIKRSLK